MIAVKASLPMLSMAYCRFIFCSASGHDDPARKAPGQGSSPLTEGKITNWGRFGIHFGGEFAFEGCSRAGSGMKPGRVIPTGRFGAIGLSGNSFGLGERAAIQRRLTRDRFQVQNC